MKPARVVPVSLLALSCLAIVAEVDAQPRQPQRNFTPPPAVSPYLNLVRRGSSPAINYYGIVRPELEFRSNINTLRGEVDVNRKSITDLRTTTDLPGTGHAVYFLNGAHPYFGQAGRTGAFARSGSAGTAPRSSGSAAAPTPAPTAPGKSQPTVGGSYTTTRPPATKS